MSSPVMMRIFGTCNCSWLTVNQFPGSPVRAGWPAPRCPLCRSSCHSSAFTLTFPPSTSQCLAAHCTFALPPRPPLASHAMKGLRWRHLPQPPSHFCSVSHPERLELYEDFSREIVDYFINQFWSKVMITVSTKVWEDTSFTMPPDGEM